MVLLKLPSNWEQDFSLKCPVSFLEALRMTVHVREVVCYNIPISININLANKNVTTCNLIVLKFNLCGSYTNLTFPFYGLSFGENRIKNIKLFQSNYSPERRDGQTKQNNSLCVSVLSSLTIMKSQHLHFGMTPYLKACCEKYL